MTPKNKNPLRIPKRTRPIRYPRTDAEVRLLAATPRSAHSLQFTAPLRPAPTPCTPLGTLYLFYRRHFRGGESKPLSALRRGDQIPCISQNFNDRRARVAQSEWLSLAR